MEIIRNESARRLSSMLQALVCPVLWLTLATSACGPLEPEPLPEELAAQRQLQVSDEPDSSPHGLSLNGLSLNGLALNGLSSTGLPLNGLSTQGLSSPAFDAWFQGDPVLNETVMRYVVRCAVPAGSTRTYQSALQGGTWSWSGGLGLAPDWARGEKATRAEQRIVSACMAAHANKFGVHIPVSILGRGATGAAIPIGLLEVLEFPEPEGCFFGNVFDPSEGIYAGNDGRELSSRNSTPRACALATRRSGPPECAPLTRIEPDCSEVCTRDLLSGGYLTCTYEGVTDPALTTRIRWQDVYTCGDGVCQVSESCGTGNEYNNCRDCGPCP